MNGTGTASTAVAIAVTIAGRYAASAAIGMNIHTAVGEGASVQDDDTAPTGTATAARPETAIRPISSYLGIGPEREISSDNQEQSSTGSILAIIPLGTTTATAATDSSGISSTAARTSRG